MAVGSLAEVEWRDVSEWPGYQVSSDGRVRSRRRTGYSGALYDDWHELKQTVSERGYLCVGMKCITKRTWIPVHVLVLTAFVGPRPEDMEACHGPAGKLVNTIGNLRWDTRTENHRDIERHGGRFAVRDARRVKGEEQGCAKLSNEKVVAIRSLYAAGGVTQRQLAAQFGVSQRAIWHVVNRKQWKHVA